MMILNHFSLYSVYDKLDYFTAPEPYKGLGGFNKKESNLLPFICIVRNTYINSGVI